MDLGDARVVLDDERADHAGRLLRRRPAARQPHGEDGAAVVRGLHRCRRAASRRGGRARGRGRAALPSALVRPAAPRRPCRGARAGSPARCRAPRPARRRSWLHSATSTQPPGPRGRDARRRVVDEVADDRHELAGRAGRPPAARVSSADLELHARARARAPTLPSSSATSAGSSIALLQAAEQLLRELDLLRGEGDGLVVAAELHEPDERVQPVGRLVRLRAQRVGHAADRVELAHELLQLGAVAQRDDRADRAPVRRSAVLWLATRTRSPREAPLVAHAAARRPRARAAGRRGGTSATGRPLDGVRAARAAGRASSLPSSTRPSASTTRTPSRMACSVAWWCW